MVLNSQICVVFLEFWCVFGLLEVFMNFWLKSGEVSWRYEDFGIFDENGDFVNSKFQPSLSELLGTYRRSHLVIKSEELG